MQDHKKVEFANTLRGFAALAVVISHYFGVFWLHRDVVAPLINAPVLPNETYATPIYVLWLNKLSFLNWGAYGVALFFIISGFVIPFSLQKSSSLSFCINRFFRIVPTYVIGFSFTLLFLFLSCKYFFISWPYHLHEILIHYMPGIRDILWSKNIDGIIWTLEIEMKFYVLAALSMVWFRHYSHKLFLLPIAFFLLAIYLNHKLPIWVVTHVSAYFCALIFIMSTQYIIFMFIGVIFHYLYCNKINSDKAYLGIGILFILFCLDWWAGPYSANLHLAWNYALALLTFMFAYCYPQLFKDNPIFNFFSRISYPLYVIHGLAGYVMLRVMMDLGFKAWTSLGSVLMIVISCSWLIHVLIEIPSQRWGKNLGAKLSNMIFITVPQRLFKSKQLQMS